jgi:hypothetical protein
LALVNKQWYLLSYDPTFLFIRKTIPTKKDWLDPLQEKDKQKIDQLFQLQELIAKNAAEFCHSGHTCTIESFHGVRSKLAPKHIQWTKTWKARTILTTSYRNWGKKATWTFLTHQLGIDCTELLLNKWEDLEKKEDQKKKKRSSKVFQQKEKIKKIKKIKYKQEEKKNSASLYEYQKTNSLIDSTSVKKTTCSCKKSSCIQGNCGCHKNKTKCIGCACQNCKNQ